jgi:hypothetical protein
MEADGFSFFLIHVSCHSCVHHASFAWWRRVSCSQSIRCIKSENIPSMLDRGLLLNADHLQGFRRNGGIYWKVTVLDR